MNNRIRLAIADDHTMLRQGIVALCRDFDIDLIAEASNGVELIEKLSAAKVLPDVCILDINMPQMNGYETLTALKKKWPGIHVLALSMHVTEFPIIRMLRGGAGGYLVKDGPTGELLKAIRSVMATGYYRSELVRDAERELGNGAPINITDKEMAFLSWCCCDLVYKEIAQKMGISPRTVESYAKILCDKLGVKSRIGLVMAALSMGIEPAE